jgi:hypothetical protein
MEGIVPGLLLNLTCRLLQLFAPLSLADSQRRSGAREAVEASETSDL